MPRSSWLTRCLALTAWLWAVANKAPGARARCDLVKVTQVPLEPKGRLFTVPVSVNGRMTSMVLDTGAKVNLLTDAAAERLGVVRDGRTATIVTGMAGGSLRADGRLDSMSLGGVPLSVDRISVNFIGFYGRWAGEA